MDPVADDTRDFGVVSTVKEDLAKDTFGVPLFLFLTNPIVCPSVRLWSLLSRYHDDLLRTDTMAAEATRTSNQKEAHKQPFYRCEFASHRQQNC